MSFSPQNKLQTLLIVSAVPHYEFDGAIHAYGPYAREIDIWADLFDHVRIAAPLRRERPPKDWTPFTRSNLSVVEQLETGGDRLSAKLIQILALPIHAIKLAKAMLTSDAIHVRCPGNLGLMGAVLAPLFSKRIIAKYAGQWRGGERIPIGFRFQRWILGSRWWSKGIALVYGQWPQMPGHVVPFFTSMMTGDQVRRAALAASRKSLGNPVQILYSGRLVPLKGIDLLIQSAQTLEAAGLDFHITILGDGPTKGKFEKLAADLQVQHRVTFAGAVPYNDVMAWYGKAHILVLASNSEGWPKALAEAMCHGVVCVASATGLMPWMLQDRGETFPLDQPAALSEAILKVAGDAQRYLELSKNAAEWAQAYSLDKMRDSIKELLSVEWNVPIETRTRLLEDRVANL